MDYLSKNEFMDSEFQMTVKTREVTLSVEEYLSRFRNAELFIKRCMECRNYNRNWSCPPYSHDIPAELRQYSHITITATTITPKKKNLPLSEWNSIVGPERERVEKHLLAMEKERGGRAFGFGGTCSYCPEDECTRPKGLPCRHPELVRPSLEAYGFDISKTLAELFDIELVWGEEGFMPEYITLVSGCMFDKNIQ